MCIVVLGFEVEEKEVIQGLLPVRATCATRTHAHVKWLTSCPPEVSPPALLPSSHEQPYPFVTGEHSMERDNKCVRAFHTYRTVSYR